MSYDKAVSYSGLKLYKTCPKAWADQYISGNRRSSGAAAQRGTKIHDLIEQFYKQRIWPNNQPVLRPWERQLRGLLKYNPTAEADLAVDKDWNPVGFEDDNAYLRGKADLLFWKPENERHIVDWKTGRIYPDHEHQGKTYFALDAATSRESDKTIVTMVYLDKKETREWTYRPNELDETIEELRYDIEILRADEEYKPTPSLDACNYCPLSWRNGGKCNAAP